MSLTWDIPQSYKVQIMNKVPSTVTLDKFHLRRISRSEAPVWVNSYTGCALFSALREQLCKAHIPPEDTHCLSWTSVGHKHTLPPRK